ncbi:MAG: hypothetical protein KKE50_00140, partial [Nanoarchaeota archaeon]|nr:hypothetical protein [Nanoarchaeota archaeon]
MRNKNKLLIGIVLVLFVLAIAGLAVVSASQEEISQLESEISGAGFDWLINYSVDAPRISVFEFGGSSEIGSFGISGEKSYKIFPNYTNSDVYDL